MEREDRECHDVENWRRAQYQADYVHPESLVPNQDRQPRSQAEAPAQDEGAARVGDNSNDMAITAFPTLEPRLRSVAYPDNFKPNI
jgi:hypothetical protein